MYLPLVPTVQAGTAVPRYHGTVGTVVRRYRGTSTSKYRRYGTVVPRYRTVGRYRVPVLAGTYGTVGTAGTVVFTPASTVVRLRELVPVCSLLLQ